MDNQRNSSGIFHRLTREALLMAGTDAALSLRGVLTLTVFGKFLGPASYGSWVSVMLTVGVLLPLAGMGLSTALMRYLPAEAVEQRKKDLFSCIVLAGLVGTVLALILDVAVKPVTLYFLDGVVQPGWIRIASLLIPITAMERTAASYWRGTRQLKIYAALALGGAFFEVGAIAFCAWRDFYIQGILLSMVAVRAVLFLASLSLIVSQMGLALPNFGTLPRHLKIGLPLVPSALFYWIIYSTDRYVLGAYHGAKAVGLYASVATLAQVLASLAAPLYFVLLPHLSEHWHRGESEEVERALAWTIHIYSFLGIPAMVGLWLVGPHLLQFLTNPAFQSATGIIPLLAVGVFLIQLVGVCDYVFVLAQKTHVIFVVLALASVSNVVLNLLLVPNGGLRGAGWALLLTALIVVVLNLTLASRSVRFRPNAPLLFKFCLAAAGMGLLVQGLLRMTQDSLLSLIIPVGALSYLGLLLALRAVRWQDVTSFIFQLFPQKTS